jgi:hypothetical protein
MRGSTTGDAPPDGDPDKFGHAGSANSKFFDSVDWPDGGDDDDDDDVGVHLARTLTESMHNNKLSHHKMKRFQSAVRSDPSLMVMRRHFLAWQRFFKEKSRSHFMDFYSGLRGGDAEQVIDDRIDELIETYYPEKRAAATKPKTISGRIARSLGFEYFSQLVILTSTAWLGIDLEMNTARVVNESEPAFMVGHNVFCALFVLEFAVRVLDNGAEVIFISRFVMLDALLAIITVIEIWLLPLWVIHGDLEMKDAGFLGLFRILRVSRASALVLRMVRSVPEMVTIVKGLSKAFNPMLFTACLIAIYNWVSAILVMQLLNSGYVGGVAWTTLARCNLQLLGFFAFFEGTIDAVEPMADKQLMSASDVQLTLQHWLAAFACFAFIFFVGFVLFNVYAGMLVNCIASVSENEAKETAAVGLFHGLRDCLEEVDPNLTGEVSLRGWDTMAQMDEFHKAVSEIGLKKHHLPILRHAFFDDEMRVFHSYRELLHEIVHMDPDIPANRMDVAETRNKVRDLVKFSNTTLHVHSERIRRSQDTTQKKMADVLSSLSNSAAVPHF